MAFIKECLVKISTCVKCGGSATICSKNEWFCESCFKEKEKECKKN